MTRIFMKGICFLMLCAATSLQAQNSITVDIPNVPAAEGKISVALYSDAGSFLKFESVFASASSEARKGGTKVTLKDIPNGEYAIALFYDKNNNNKLDKNWMGIPKEKVAFSNAKMKLFGPPSYKECAFTITSDKTLVIPL